MKKKIIEGTKKYICEDGFIYNEKGRRFSRWIDNTGYYQSVFQEDRKRRFVRIHRLLAIAFIDNPNNYNQVNHIDGNKLNNSLSNLEWTTNQLNTKHGYDNNLYKSRLKCMVIAKCKNSGEEILFDSIRSCSSELNINRKTLTSILKGTKITNNYNYDFEYKV